VALPIAHHKTAPNAAAYARPSTRRVPPAARLVQRGVGETSSLPSLRRNAGIVQFRRDKVLSTQNLQPVQRNSTRMYRARGGGSTTTSILRQSASPPSPMRAEPGAGRLVLPEGDGQVSLALATPLLHQCQTRRPRRPPGSLRRRGVATAAHRSRSPDRVLIQRVRVDDVKARVFKACVPGTEGSQPRWPSPAQTTARLVQVFSGAAVSCRPGPPERVRL
jgi:hypothetical protein